MSFTRIPEGAVQLIAEKIILATPGRKNGIMRIESNFHFTNNSKSKYADIAILDNNKSKDILAVIELKVLTSKLGKDAHINKDELLKDVLKLTMISKEKGYKCFFLLVGEYDQAIKIINNKRKTTHSINSILNYDGDLEKRIDGRKAKNIFRDLNHCQKSIRKHGFKPTDIQDIYTQLRRKSVVGLRVNESKKMQKFRTAAFLWQVSHSEECLKGSIDLGDIN